MGAGQSNTSHAHPPSRALHVLRVTPKSPASHTSIEPFFDFIVGFEGDSLASQNSIDAAQLERIVEEHEGGILNLLVWNSKTKATREVPIAPSRAWSTPHIVKHPDADMDEQPSLLGLSMRMCVPESALDYVWAVLDVLEGSPAESAGLVPYGDWIIGYSEGVLSAEGDLYDLVEGHMDKPLRVYVYSYDFDTLREVVLVPNRQWGGEGLLGCVFGFGLLHRIPARQADENEGNATPPEMMESSDSYEEDETFVPADEFEGYDVYPNQQAHSHTNGHNHSHQDHDHSHDHNHSHGHSHTSRPPHGRPTPARSSSSTWAGNGMLSPLVSGTMNGTTTTPRRSQFVGGLEAEDLDSDHHHSEGEDGDDDGEGSEDGSHSVGSLTSVE